MSYKEKDAEYAQLVDHLARKFVADVMEQFRKEGADTSSPYLLDIAWRAFKRAAAIIHDEHPAVSNG